MIFKREFLMDELDLPSEALENKIIDQGRWSTLYEIIFKYNGKFYETSYSVGSTEYQYEAPWEYEDEVECVEVEKRQVMVEKWMPVECAE